MVIGLAETFHKIAALPVKERAAALQKFGNEKPAVRTILQYAFHPEIIWELPRGTPPFKPNRFVDQEGMMWNEVRRLYLFVRGGNDNLKQLKREYLFIQLLENVAPQDAEMLINIKDKKPPVPGITLGLVKEAFPGLVPEETVLAEINVETQPKKPVKEPTKPKKAPVKKVAKAKAKKKPVEKKPAIKEAVKEVVEEPKNEMLPEGFDKLSQYEKEQIEEQIRIAMQEQNK